MTLRLYFIPVVTVGTGRAPKYLTGRISTGDSALLGVPWGMNDFGLEPLMLISADTDSVQDTFLTAQSDVVAVPANLDSTISAAGVTRIQAYFEAANLPSGWVTTAITYRFFLRVVIGVFTFMNRIAGIVGGRVFSGAVVLDTQFNQLGLGARTAIQRAAADLSLDSTGVGGTTTIREILRLTGQQYSARAFVFPVTGVQI